MCVLRLDRTRRSACLGHRAAQPRPPAARPGDGLPAAGSGAPTDAAAHAARAPRGVGVAALDQEQLLPQDLLPGVAAVRRALGHQDVSEEEGPGRRALRRDPALSALQPQLLRRDGGRCAPRQLRGRGRHVPLLGVRRRLHRRLQGDEIPLPAPLPRARGLPRGEEPGCRGEGRRGRRVQCLARDGDLPAADREEGRGDPRRPLRHHLPLHAEVDGARARGTPQGASPAA